MAPAIGRGIGQSFAPAYPHFVTRGLVALYDFVQGADSQVLYDISGNGNDGQLGSTTGVDTNDPIWTSEGLSFDGVDDYIGTPIGFNSSGVQFSVLAAVEWPAASTVTRRISGNSSGTNGWAFGMNDTEAQRFTTLGVKDFDDPTVLTSGNKYFVGVTYDDSTFEAVLYRGASVVTTSSAASGMTSSTNNLRIGDRGAGTERWNAPVYLECLYDVILTPAEVAQNYRAAQHLLSLRGITI
jgi:hypothetical protein